MSEAPKEMDDRHEIPPQIVRRWDVEKYEWVYIEGRVIYGDDELYILAATAEQRIKSREKEVRKATKEALEAEQQLADKDKEIVELQERITMAYSYLPESPNKAAGFLKPALKGPT